jgi:hypothetical protein
MLLNFPLKQICHPDRSVAKWRDLLFTASINRCQRGAPLSPLSSRAKSRDLQFNGPLVEMFSTERTRISCHAALDKAEYAPFRKERRMKCDHAAKFYRKSGIAQWDLLFTQCGVVDTFVLVLNHRNLIGGSPGSSKLILECVHRLSGRSIYASPGCCMRS